MKRIIYFLAIVSVFAIAVTISIKPIIIFLAKSQFKRVFIASTVSIQDCDFKPLRQLSLFDVEIKRPQIYDFKISQINIEYNLGSMLKRNITKVCLQDATLKINLADKSILNLHQYLHLGKQLFLVKNAELTNFNLNLKSKDLYLEGKVSLGLDLIDRLINYCDLKIEAFQNYGLDLKDARLEARQKQARGEFYVEEIKFNKLKISEMNSEVKLVAKGLFLDALSAQILQGRVQADISFKLDKLPEFLLNLKFMDLDLATLVEEFNLEEKVQMSGKLTGRVILEGRGSYLNVISGDFNTLEPGGILTIKDTGFLEKIARSSNQPLDIVVESFKNYRYNKGVIKLSLDGDNLILDAALDGEEGKRNLNITLHNFRLRRDGL